MDYVDVYYPLIHRDTKSTIQLTSSKVILDIFLMLGSEKTWLRKIISRYTETAVLLKDQLFIMVYIKI